LFADDFVADSPSVSTQTPLLTGPSELPPSADGPVPACESSSPLPVESTPSSSVAPPPDRQKRVIQPPVRFRDYIVGSATFSIYELSSYREACSNPDWQQAMTDELQALAKTHTWDVVDLPSGKTPISCKWVYKIKTKSDGSIERYKARLVARGFTQEYGIDYEETFAPVARLTSVRSLIAVAAARSWPLNQMDVKNAFLNGDLTEEVYMHPPLGSSIQSPKVCRLRRALYGLKQAPRAWFAKFSTTVCEFGFTPSSYDSALFLRKIAGGTILLLLYVDDMIITGDDLPGISHLKQFLSRQFEMKDLGALNYFLGWKSLRILQAIFSHRQNMPLIFWLVLVSLIARLLLPLLMLRLGLLL